jgi:Transglutaminase-like superfamily
MRQALLVTCCVAALAVLGSARGLAADDVPAPQFERVDRDRGKPERFLDLDPRAGDSARVREIAKGLKRPTGLGTLAAIDRYMVRAFEWDEAAFDDWRSVERMVAEGTYGGCADHAMVFGTLARACGVPTVWLKSMDLAWISKFRSHAFDPSREAWSGHVFLEVYVDGAWRLLDAQGGTIYMRYDPSARLLPAGKFAYDKGGKPWDLLLSVRWEDWKRQTAAYFETADPGRLSEPGEDAKPKWGDPRSLNPRVYVAGNHPRYLWASAAAASSGYHVATTFNTDFERVLANAAGQIVLVTCQDGSPVFPESLRSEWLPQGWKAALSGDDLGGPGWIDRKRADGTRVVLVTAPGRHPLEKAVADALEK